MEPGNVQMLAQKELQPGESLAWAGQGIPTRAALARLPVSVFGIFFAGFALFWMWVAAGGSKTVAGRDGPFQLFPLFGLPFLLIGLALIVSPLWVYTKGKRTIYAVTDQRVMIITSGRNTTVKSFGPGDIVSIEHNERANGTGDIVIQTKVILAAGNNTMRPATVGFYGIPAVLTVERLVMDLHKKQHSD